MMVFSVAAYASFWQTFRLDSYARSGGHTVFQLDLLPSPALGHRFWEWVRIVDAKENLAQAPTVLSLPRLSQREVMAFADIIDVAPDTLGVRLHPLPDEVAPGLVADMSTGGALANGRIGGGSAPVDEIAAEARMRAWVRRTLAPTGSLKLCPYTASDALAGVRLESLGVSAAPVMHAVSDAAGAAGILADVTSCIDRMVKGGEEATSSIIMSAPAWDDRWEEWHRTIFPLLEETILACGLGRTVGVVCFHPAYAIPPPEFLARHRFGHIWRSSKQRC